MAEPSRAAVRGRLKSRLLKIAARRVFVAKVMEVLQFEWRPPELPVPL
jgi:hypothetical protein